MSHECEDCGETFETLSRLRLHDCPGKLGSAPGTSDRAADVEQLDDLLDDAASGETSTLHRALATYEQHLAAAHEANRSDSFRQISRTYT